MCTGCAALFFAISKIGWLIVQPIGLVALCLFAAALLSLAGRRVLAGMVALAGLMIVLTGAQTNLGRLALQPLENRFARPVELPPASDVAGIIVLGGGFDGHVTLSRGGFELGESGDRFVEAVRLAVHYKDAPVVISGGDASLIGRTEGDAPVAVRLFAAFGIDESRLILESRSLNTHENALYSRQVLPTGRDGEWILVTSAFHMPRSVGVFAGQGVAVLPWPVDFRTGGAERLAIGRDDPVKAFAELSLAIREWMGLMVYRWTGRMARLAQ